VDFSTRPQPAQAVHAGHTQKIAPKSVDTNDNDRTVKYDSPVITTAGQQAKAGDQYQIF
jgi:hypothetical protein